MKIRYFLLLLAGSMAGAVNAQKIDRKALVQRHKIVITKADTLSSLTVGNGRFAMTVDITGLQSFPEYYHRGVPLGTQSEWGWHSFPDTIGYKREEAQKSYMLNGRPVSYTVQWNSPERNKAAANWYRQNPHRLQLGQLGFILLKKDGSRATITDLQNIHQELDPWTGLVESNFTLEGTPVGIRTSCAGTSDAVAVSVQSDLLTAGRMKLFLHFPYPTGAWTDEGVNDAFHERHQSRILSKERNSATVLHALDTTKYYSALRWSAGTIAEGAPHTFVLTPARGSRFDLSLRYAPAPAVAPATEAIFRSSAAAWEKYWTEGGAIDFSGSTDPRAFELERRIILSHYLLRAQEAGSFPPQETGLTYNSWFGKPHLEMTLWHAAHYAYWGHTELLEGLMEWYAAVAPNARDIAQRQGYGGLRWQKMTDNAGTEAPSSVGAFLVWQQPHYIWFAESLYRNGDSSHALKRYRDLVFATADFMASFARYDSSLQRYVLGKGLIAAQERFKAEQTFNPAYELVYWKWALETAQQWRTRSGMTRNAAWDRVLAQLSPLPVQDGKYLFTESATDSYTNPEFRTDHPSVLGALGMLPATGQVDTRIMKNTFDWIWQNWSWKETWGWDFPMTAMTATRLGMPDTAIAALLLPVQTNTYLPNGHNYQDERLRIYLPGNGGTLLAAALMVAGYEGSAPMPGIPRSGRWKVRYEGLRRLP
jgi:hypothetical protein